MVAPILSLHQCDQAARDSFERKIASLRSLSGILKSTPSRESFAFSRLREGVPRGAITEICGPNGHGKTQLALSLIAENPETRVAWIEDRFTAYPSSFPQFGVQLERLLFVEGGKETLWAAHQILRSRIFELVVISSTIASVVELRRLQLSAEQARASVILLSQNLRAQGTWPIALQIEMSGNPKARLKVIKGTSYGEAGHLPSLCESG